MARFLLWFHKAIFMKSILFFLLLGSFSLFISPEISENILQETEWQTGPLLGFDTNTTTFNLTPKPTGRSFGNHVVFKTDGSFESYYAAPCGNDCFTRVYGAYHLDKDQQTLQLQIHQMTYEGDCARSSDHFHNRSLRFQLQQKEEGLSLVKI